MTVLLRAASCAPELATVDTGNWRALHCWCPPLKRTNLFTRVHAWPLNFGVYLNLLASLTYENLASHAHSSRANISYTSCLALRSSRVWVRWRHQPCIFMSSRSRMCITGMPRRRIASESVTTRSLIVGGTRMSTLTQRPSVFQPGRRQ